MKTHSNPKTRGFTLIELMVAMSVTTIIVSVLVSITSIALDTWSRSRSEVRAARQAKSMVDSMARDFEALVSRRSGDAEWLYAKADTTSSTGSRLESTNACELIFFTAPTDRYDGDLSEDRGNKLGDISCVSYGLKYQDPIMGTNAGGNFKTFVLYRMLVNPDETFQNLLGQQDLSSAFGSYASDLSDVENFLCENVFQYTITFNVEVLKDAGGGSFETKNVPVSLSSKGSGTSEFRIKSGTLDVDSFSGGSVTAEELATGRIAAVEISLTVLTDFGVDQLRNRNFGTDSAKQEFLAKNSYQYSKLVKVPSR